MIDIADRHLLSQVQIALETPFRDPVRVAGQLMPRRLARQIERQLLRLRVLEREAYPAPTPFQTDARADHRHGEGFPPVARPVPVRPVFANPLHDEATNG